MLLRSPPCHIGGGQGIPMVQHAGTGSMHSPLPHARKATPPPPCLHPWGRSSAGRGVTICCRTWGWMQAHTLTHVLLGLGHSSKRVSSFCTWPWVLCFRTLSVIYFNSKSAAPIKHCQVLPEQPMVPFLALTTPSLMRQMRSPGPFPKYGSVSPASPSAPTVNPMLPPMPAPPVHPHVRRRAGSRAQYPPHQNSRQSSRKRRRENGARRGEQGRFCSPTALQHGGRHEQRPSCPLPALRHLLPVPAGTLRPGRTRGSAKSPWLNFWGWHPGSHPAAQRRLEGFAWFPHRAGNFARKSKFINSAFRHEQNESRRTRQSDKPGAEHRSLPSTLPHQEEWSFPSITQLARTILTPWKARIWRCLCQMCYLGTPFLQLVWQ